MSKRHIFEKMDPEIKAEWLEALRSGDYEQGTGSLCKNDKYCCLGVLYDATQDDYWLPPRSRGWRVPDKFGATQGIFGRKLLDHSAITALIAMNDTGRKSFKHIANWIEKNL